MLGAQGDTSNFLYAFKLSENNPPTGGGEDTYYGINAIFSINGGSQISSESNKITGFIPGVILDIKSEGKSSITVSTDKQEIKKSVKDFVEKWNEVFELVDSKLKEERVFNSTDAEENSKGKLTSNSTLIMIRDRLLNMIVSTAEGLPQDMNMLEQVGIKLTYTQNYKNVKLTFDESKFDRELTNNFEKVKDLISSVNGVLQMAYGTINELISFSGPVNMEIRTLTEEINNNIKRITEYEYKLLMEEQRLREQYYAMEQIISKLNSQLQTFNTWLNALNKR